MKIDFKKQLATYAAPWGRFEVVTVPPMRFLMIAGHGDPNTSPAYQDAVTTIFPVAYALKFLSKKELGRDHTVMPWRVSGGPRTWPPSPAPATNPDGAGR